MLRFTYHVRYELLEFAVFTLAARAQRLVPLHAACVGLRGSGILILGPSGSGKSTVTLHCLLAGLDFLAEDSVMVKPDELLATGVANFLHVRRDSLRFLAHLADAAQISKSPIIRRRSGVEKLEIDLRRAGLRLARAPLRISAIVFVTAKRATRHRLLAPVRETDLVRRLAASQRYAAGQPGWRSFTRQVRRLPAYELRRGRHPAEAVEALRQLLCSTP
jgi:energy-coupling factor transporter ATP-binding protein EcfA2